MKIAMELVKRRTEYHNGKDSGPPPVAVETKGAGTRPNIDFNEFFESGQGGRKDFNSVFAEVLSLSRWKSCTQCVGKCKEPSCTELIENPEFNARCEIKYWKMGMCVHNGPQRCPECTTCAHARGCACAGCLVAAIDLLENPTAGIDSAQASVQRLEERTHVIAVFEKDIQERAQRVSALLEDLIVNYGIKMLDLGYNIVISAKAPKFYKEVALLVRCC